MEDKYLLIKEEPIHSLHQIFLWLNSGCNSRCKMCDIWKEKPGKQISVDDVAKWAPEWARMSIARVVLCGESLMHPGLWDITKIIHNNGIRIELLSNGYLLEKYAQNIVESCDVLRVSLDGPSEIHGQTRGIKMAFKKLRKGIESIHSLSPNYIVDGRCAIHRRNFLYIRETVAVAKELGLHSISFSGTDLYNEEAFKRIGTVNEQYVDSLIIRGNDLYALKRELTALQEERAEDFKTGFISDTPEELDRLVYQYYQGLAGQAPLPAVRCNAPWVSTVIDYDGTVRPCFPLAAYGNIHQYGMLNAIINSRQAKNFRDTLNVQTNLACQKCVCQTAIYA